MHEDVLTRLTPQSGKGRFFRDVHLYEKEKKSLMRRAKILCTVGPKSATPHMLEALLNNGMNMVRLNMSHGTHHWHAKTIKMIRDVEVKLNVSIPIMVDLQGPRIRIGTLSSKGMELISGQSISLTPIDSQRSKKRGVVNVKSASLPIGYPTLSQDVLPKQRILINDGLIELRVVKVAKKHVTCSVIVGGRVTSNKGVNLPDTSLSTSSLTPKDHEDIRLAVEHNVDYIALSFVRSAIDIQAVKRIIRRSGSAIPVIAKIERPEAVNRLDKILDHADGVMVARGDLAIEMTLEAVPILQKQIIAVANRRHRLVITATQMLESMTQHSIPTRAEASDVANAVLDGSDVLMLSAETSTGQYPVQAVQVMDRVIRSAENSDVLRWEPANATQDFSASVVASTCVAAASAARFIQAHVIVVFTDSGTTALLMSKQRPNVPIVGLTPFTSSLRRMETFWGVAPYLMHHISNTDERIEMAEMILKRHRLVESGNRVVILSGEHGQKRTGTNLMKVYEVH
ncbi:MAG: pyruvate kinase [Nitrospirales bacterium]|nr:MAG: pyruvate kinase [Nitrospirales bacterium]